MAQGVFVRRIGACLFWLIAAVPAMATVVKIDPTPAGLAHAMQGHAVVLVGEVHDNAVQHALRAAALRRLLETGARPAIALEQFDREHQMDIDRARRERPNDAAYLIAQAKGDPGWRWEFYRPIVALALEYDLPIIAANLSRQDAIRVAIDGWKAVFDASTIRGLRLDALPPNYQRKQEEAISAGHCNTLSPEETSTRARAQIARDIIMAQSLRPYLKRGVVLLAGNGHVRRDIGVPIWLHAEATSIGILEPDEDFANFDSYVVTEPATRPDPCKGLRPL